MTKRRKADEVTRLLREADRDLAIGLTVGDSIFRLLRALMRVVPNFEPGRIPSSPRRDPRAPGG
jgi:hypothetical protein